MSEKVLFLGGTCNGSNWRDLVIPKLNIKYFNPVVDDWTPECQAEEIRQREICDFVLYTITPQMLGVYSIAEVVDDSNKRPEKTLFLLLDYDSGYFTLDQEKSLEAVWNLVGKNGAKTFRNIDQLVGYLNNQI